MARLPLPPSGLLIAQRHIAYSVIVVTHTSMVIHKSHVCMSSTAILAQARSLSLSDLPLAACRPDMVEEDGWNDQVDERSERLLVEADDKALQGLDPVGKIGRVAIRRPGRDCRLVPPTCAWSSLVQGVFT